MAQTELGERRRISEAMLERWRTESNGPVFLKLDNQVRYWVHDVEAFEEVALRGSTKPDGRAEQAEKGPRYSARHPQSVTPPARQIRIWLRTGSRNTRLRPLVAAPTLPR